MKRQASSLFEDTKRAVRAQGVDQPRYFQSERMGFSVCAETGGITATVLDRIGRVRTVGARPRKQVYTKDDFEIMIGEIVRSYRSQSMRFSQPSIMENMKPVIVPFLESILHESNQKWLEELYSAKKRRYNPNGFHVIEVIKVATGDVNTDFSLRLHLYDPHARQRMVESIHVHKWHLESMILAGTFRQLVYDSPGIEEQTWENTFLKWQGKKAGLRSNFRELIGDPGSAYPEQSQKVQDSYWFTPEIQEDSLSKSDICYEKEHDCKDFPRYLAGVVYRTERTSFREQRFARLADDMIDLVKFADREEKPGNYYFLDAKIPHCVVATAEPPATLLITHPVGPHRKDGWVFKALDASAAKTPYYDFDAKSKEEKQKVFDDMERELMETTSEAQTIADNMSFDEFKSKLEALLNNVVINFPYGSGSQQVVPIDSVGPHE